MCIQIILSDLDLLVDFHVIRSMHISICPYGNPFGCETLVDTVRSLAAMLGTCNFFWPVVDGAKWTFGSSHSCHWTSRRVDRIHTAHQTLCFGDKRLFKWSRLQHPLRPAHPTTLESAYSTTLHAPSPKVTTLESVGLYLANPYFAHGQLYAAESRAGEPTQTKYYVSSTNNNSTPNVVCAEGLLPA